MNMTVGRKCICSFILYSLCCLDACAGVSGNIANFPEKGKLTASYEYTKVENRRIVEYDGGSLWIVDSSQRNLGKLSYGVEENMAVDFRLGSNTLELEPENNYGGDPGMRFDTGDAWGLGLRVRLFENSERNMAVGAGFQYQHFSNDNAIRYYPNDPFSCKSEEWHVSVDVARKLNKHLLLYTSGRYSEIALPYTHADPHIPRIGGFEERDNLGIAVGAEIKLAKKISLSLEKRFVDEDAYTAALHYTF